MPDFSKIVENVKSMISTTSIPETSKDDPVGYRLSELSKIVKAIIEAHQSLGTEIAKLETMLGSLYQECLPFLKKPSAQQGTTVAATKPEAGKEKTEEEKK